MDDVAGRKHGFESLADMARSLGVVLAAVLVLLLITIRPHGQVVQVVDYHPTLQLAKIGEPFVLVAPIGLPSQWRPTSDYFDPPQVTRISGVSMWHIGFITPTNAYAGFEQTNRLVADALSAQISDPVAAGTSVVRGVAWERWTGGGRRALTLVRTPVTIVVDGTAGWGELEQLAGSLQPQR
jgi:hypothetical protein